MAWLRDAAFLAIGQKPLELCLDLSGMSAPIDAQGVETLLTIHRVASMLKVRLRVVMNAAREDFCRKTGLSRRIAVGNEMTFVAGAPKGT